MRKLLVVIVALIAIAGGSCILIAAHFRHQAQDEVMRAEALAIDLQKLMVGNSDYKAARAIATKFGTVPYENHWGTRDCSRGYFDRCAYKIASNHIRTRGLLLRHPFLRHLGLHDWAGNSLIYIENGIVQDYSFSVIYKTADEQWRGVGVEEGSTIPKNRAVQARISDSYSIQRNDVIMSDRPNDQGFELEASLTPASTAAERRRAWHFELKCLLQERGCGEICEVIPDAWRDFYTQRGHFDVDKYGSAYLFCAEPPR